ncbi:unnamed protein product [marine sediment metagenome]|uniref:Uncharacterized protein n=1 Tax=marine sediment metagenome TaxID=412755 RepID=X0X599_9ZZZZ
MITATLITVNSYAIKLDSADRKAVRDLAGAYAITFDAMLVACINKGIEVINKQVQHADKKIIDDSACDDIC